MDDDVVLDADALNLREEEKEEGSNDDGGRQRGGDGQGEGGDQHGVGEAEPRQDGSGGGGEGEEGDGEGEEELKAPLRGVIGAVRVEDLPAPAEHTFNTYLVDEAHPLYIKAMDHLRKEPDEDRPYDHMYKCRDELKQLQAAIKVKGEELSVQHEHRQVLKCCLARLDNIIGSLFVDTDEISEGCKLLEQAIDVGEPVPTMLGTCVLDGMNRLGIVWADRKEFSRALDMLQRAKALYVALKAQDDAPWGRCELLPVQGDEERMDELENTYTHCLFYLAQCYMQLDQPGKSAEYCQQTLARQYETGQFDKLDWATNAAAISQYYLSENAFSDARMYLACAQAVADTEERDDEDTQQKKAAIAQCWVKYHLTLLNASWELVQGNVSEEDVKSTLEPALPLHVPNMHTYIHRTPTTLARTSEDARKYFLQGQKWIQAALKFFTLDEHASGHVACVQDHSQLYRMLAQFEENSDHAAKMHKRRVDMLENTLNELNPQYYLAVCKQLAFELGNACQDMMDLKLAKFNAQTPDVKLMAKITKLGSKSIMYFQRFIDLHRDHKKALPETYEDGAAKGVMTAHFTIARVYSKLLAPDKAQRVKNLKECLRYHQYIVDYCENHPDFTEFARELELSKEMVQLLPAQIQRI
ncbi:hypothetical protein PTSG_12368 [Salpingoeca rosetta]|uniref:KIF-binding protein n=1 Tax=Salpingoeca rosetta (strain ATCC 50818 / BSB-021) TaxID=946362 RepID=F2UD68_SALR5|nr:uncharacterized protein PTSG_12368 [Salpingoeca rosetta]EGD74563.1 hypothetical protein PTSG_12368 [Salpingoeca rosetta]|eukprot:XP_004992820.1 hypothetical protein PTSG_12368 [Salpingoeca rosetta]